ncbi:uncharacterized protein LOC129290475 [Prosopis cineraria]|uniref:uncharacterized protein LOC129290475 n=1 Tax=Prosopis cineraria TaxID=364024 RepID=UPI00240F2657|nr:uncharacterized protein LOC129290475 [Prosopis cineraria]XP_054783227.1 uncharacterized protein LOC129290475 [Prosopis cineraria]XP_054783229.1 uncharacterized protein LOC129290475 [Prosopis cineraria]XP_054783230.1 uncharacterized protein LOC129290475 [Prosopis cineraria]XP_054783231.1 uncharacterized protein LOC129290475 [Prosopis cineraria]
MGKRSQKRPKGNEKDRSGCMWGLISIFDFRHGHPTHKLITDFRHSNKLAVSEKSIMYSKNKFEMLSNLDEDCEGNFDGTQSKKTMVTTDAVKPCVKKLIEEEMFIDQDTMKNMHSAEVEFKESRLRLANPLKIDSKRKNKSRKKSRDKDTQSLKSDATLQSELSHNQHSRHQSKSSLDLDNIMEGFSHFKDVCSVIRDHNGEVLPQPNEKNVIAENNVKDAIHEFVNQITFNGKDLPEDEKFTCSQELMQVLQVISSDKELFLRLLQDPNSLLRKHVQELGNSQGTDFKEHNPVTGFSMSKQEPNNLEEATEVVNHKQRNFLGKKVTSQGKSPAKGNDNTESSKRIVTFKPGPMGLRNSETENNLFSSINSHDINHPKDHHGRVSSHFSLTEIKKKLKHAMGKERHGNPRGISKKLSIECQNMEQGSKVFSKDNIGMKSPNKDHFFIEKTARPTFDVNKGDKAGKLRDSEVTTDRKNDRCLKQKDSNLYNEAKKHLHEILGNGDENMEFSSQQIPETLGRILSLPEYNFSPIGSPGRECEHRFVTSQTRFSTVGNIQEANEDFQADIIGHPDQATKNPEKQSSISDESFNEKVQEINLKLNLPADHTHDDKVEATSCHPVRNEIVPEDLIARKDKKCDSGISDGSRPSLCLNQEISEENQPLFTSPSSSPSHPSITRKVAEMESGSAESERPSPVSVLDTPFDISPGNTRSEPDKVPVQPLHIQFEDHDSSPMDQTEGGKHCTEENKLIFDYIEAVLQSSGLNRDQLRIKYLSSNQILDQSLFDEGGFFPNQPCHDQKLLFDCINEVLVDICWDYFGILPWASFLKPSIRPNPDMKKVVLMVWQRVCWHLLPFPRPHTLDQIVHKDMAKSETWMDLRVNVETVITEMADDILAELMEETVFNCVGESLESESSQLQPELLEDKSSINI